MTKLVNFKWAVLLSVFLCTEAFAKDLIVFDVRKTLPLSSTEKVYQDYYLNGGAEEGLKPGMLVTITRRMAMYDTYTNKSPGELKVAVGRLKIIHVQSGLSVARLHSLYSRTNRPVLEYDYIMVGDQLDMNSLTMDRGKKTSEVAPEPQPMEAASAAAAMEEQPEQVEESKELSSIVPAIPELQGMVVEQKL